MGGLEENNSNEPEEQQASITYSSPIKKIVAVASISAGVQFGWALQLSLLTPYVQLLGIPHKWASYIWLCGPVSGMTVQPIVGYYSDKCRSRWGRRRPFLAVGSFLVLLAILLISFAADLGKLLGDDIHSARAKPRAIIFFVTGFWVLDVGNNMLQGPCRAFLADLAGKNEQRTRNANALFSFFLAVGNVLGYAAGSFNHLYKFLPFTSTKACDIDCANLKTCFFLSALLLLTLTILALTYVREKPLVGHQNPLSKQNEDEERMENEVEPKLVASIADIGNAIQSLPQSMWVLLLVTCLNWVAWFPFLLYDTDWMGREVYGGEVGVGKRYQSGVRVGALGLMLNSVVLGFTSLGLEFLTRKAGGVKQLWGYVNFLLALCLGFMVLISKLAEASRSEDKGHYPSLGIRISSLALFAMLGVPFAVTLILPWALASTFSNSSKAGQGLAIGILNLSICIPQIVISFTSGPWDALFGGGNLPAFVVGAIAAVASGIVALTMLPSLHPEIPPRKETISSSVSRFSNL